MKDKQTNVELEEQSKQAVIAYLQDSNVRLEESIKNNIEWREKPDNGHFNIKIYHYRIAQPKKWYRVSLLLRNSNRSKTEIIVVENENDEKYYSNLERFIKWLTDRIEYND